MARGCRGLAGQRGRTPGWAHDLASSIACTFGRDHPRAPTQQRLQSPRETKCRPTHRRPCPPPLPRAEPPPRPVRALSAVSRLRSGAWRRKRGDGVSLGNALHAGHAFPARRRARRACRLHGEGRDGGRFANGKLGRLMGEGRAADDRGFSTRGSSAVLRLRACSRRLDSSLKVRAGTVK